MSEDKKTQVAQRKACHEAVKKALREHRRRCEDE